MSERWKRPFPAVICAMSRPLVAPMIGNVQSVDIAYLRAHPEHLPTFLTHQRIRETPVHGGSIASASRLTLDDGNSVFTKTWPEGSEAPDGYFAAEAAGLRWLAEVEHGADTPEVIVAMPNLIALEWIDESTPDARRRPPVRGGAGAYACRRRGPLRRAVARLHRLAATGQHAWRWAVVGLVRRSPAATVPAHVGEPRRGRRR